MNLASCLIISGALFALAQRGVAPGFAAGFAIGTFSMMWLLRMARKGMSMSPERVERFVKFSYHIRFVLVAALMALLASRGVVSLWPMLAGLSAALFTAICTMFYLAKEECNA